MENKGCQVYDSLCGCKPCYAHRTMVINDKAEAKLFYIQDTRGYCGNSVMWWREDGHGYTTNLDEAWRVDLENAQSICANRDTDRMWPCDKIDIGSKRHFDMQYLPKFIPEPTKVKIKKKRSCNRHDDCDKAEKELLARRPDKKNEFISFSFHCHDECCEDCFGQ
jgi:hypothetical protein